MKEITKMEVLSVGKVYALSLAFFGFIAGIFVAILGSAFNTYGRGGMLGPSLGIASIILFPVIYGIIGFIAGIIGAAIYNLIVKLVGGIEIELKDK